MALVKVTFKVPEEREAEIEARARALGISKSELCRQYVEAGLGSSAFDAQLQEAQIMLKPVIAETLGRIADAAIKDALEQLPSVFEEVVKKRLGG